LKHSNLFKVKELEPTSLKKKIKKIKKERKTFFLILFNFFFLSETKQKKKIFCLIISKLNEESETEYLVKACGGEPVNSYILSKP